MKKTTSPAGIEMPEPVTLALHCAYCGGAVELQFEDWAPDNETVSQTWTCPYCGAQNEGAFLDRVASVTKRHRGLGEDH
jgi:hypothetical protein